jgi:hypothetical protein
MASMGEVEELTESARSNCVGRSRLKLDTKVLQRRLRTCARGPDNLARAADEHVRLELAQLGIADALDEHHQPQACGRRTGKAASPWSC